MYFAQFNEIRSTLIRLIVYLFFPTLMANVLKYPDIVYGTFIKRHVIITAANAFRYRILFLDYGIQLWDTVSISNRNSRMFPIESLAHDNGRSLVCAEYGYPKGSPTVKEEIRRYSSQYSARLRAPR
jgi:hypothetical protein